MVRGTGGCRDQAKRTDDIASRPDRYARTPAQRSEVHRYRPQDVVDQPQLKTPIGFLGRPIGVGEPLKFYGDFRP
jgi:hypothetical protein